MVNYAKIKLWDELVGIVAWNPNSGTANFEYDAKFVTKGLEVSPLKMPLRAGQVYSFPELNTETFKGLPGMLADSLPDNFGNTLINKWLAEQGRDVDSYNPIERLLYQGQRSMGALEFEPAEKVVKNTSSKIELNSLIVAVQHALNEKEKTTANINGSGGLMEIIKVGTSAGGARAKAVIAYNEQTGEIRSGQIGAPAGFSHWLIKFDGIDSGLKDPMHFGQIEYVYYQMAIMCGIEMSESQLLTENGRHHFMTRRFDRIGNNEKLHTQTLCGLAHYDFNASGTYSYEQLFQTMRTLRLPYNAAEQIFRRMVFNVVARNQDDHTKNFSFLMDKKGEWALAPAYDMAFCYNPAGKYTSLHQMSINGKRNNFDKKDFIKIANSMNIKKPIEIMEEVATAVRQWSKLANEQGIAKSQIEMIGKTHRFFSHSALCYRT
jgi:serine/threonine-protein kinase HipA